MNSNDVLQRLLSRKIEKIEPATIVVKGRPGRPKKSEEKKARNFTLCLAPEFLNFLDRMKVRDPKVQGRGRKIRFIIERFIEHEKRSLQHMKVLKEALHEVHRVVESFSSVVKKGESLNLSPRDREKISKAVDQVHTLLRILGYSPKTLRRMLNPQDWSLLSFCLDWKSNRELVF